MPTINLKSSTLLEEMLPAKQRFIIQQGGTSSGKSYSILNRLIIIAGQDDGCLISIVSESIPHLKRGVMRDFFNILGDAYLTENHNKTDNSYKIGRSVIEFFSTDQPDKVRGARRDYLFINECNNIKYEAFQQLEVRTKNQVFLDFNPVAEFWVHEKVLPYFDCKFRKSTYKDNPYLDANIVKSIEARRAIDNNWWRIYGEGEVGNYDGLIFKQFNIVDTLPESQYFYALDFGFTNDPSACIKMCINDGQLWCHEILYQTGLTNSDIYRTLISQGVGPEDLLVCDSAEPKSIEELYRLGLKNTHPCGTKDILNGISLLQSLPINVTKSSVNLIKELRNYSWQKDKDGKQINKPCDIYNHGIDAMRYGYSFKFYKRQGQRAIVL